jgi:5,10-methylenetetrahydrofolate reductase
MPSEQRHDSSHSAYRNTPLREKIAAGRFVITVEMEPPRGSDVEPVLSKIARLAPFVDAVNIADSPMANLRMSPIALAHIMQADAGVESIFHLTCRDRNLLGLQAELLGAAALGVRNLLALTGDPPEKGDHPKASGVFDVDSLGLAALARSLNQGVDLNGRALDKPTRFFIGGVANPGAEDLGLEIAKFEKKIAHGVDFFQTQPIFDLRRWERFHKAVEAHGIPVLYGVLPLKSHKSAVYLAEKVPGMNIPESVQRRMAAGGPEEGVAIARELLKEIASSSCGAHLFPMGNPDIALAVLQGFR